MIQMIHLVGIRDLSLQAYVVRLKRISGLGASSERNEPDHSKELQASTALGLTGHATTLPYSHHEHINHQAA